MTQARAKMYEYAVLEEDYNQLSERPSRLLSLTIGILGDYGKQGISGAQELVETNRKDLLFSAQYFDSYVQSQLNDLYADYLLIVGSAAYYLADLTGSSKVLINKLAESTLDLEAEGLENLLVWLLKNDLTEQLSFDYEVMTNAYDSIRHYLENGGDVDSIHINLEALCKYIYANGSDRQVLFSDLVRSIGKKRIFNSTWSCLPRYTGLPVEDWTNIIRKGAFIKEFWPAQRLLGEKEVFKGKSAVIQMPTSAGKTKSTELIIRSSILSGRSRMAVIIAPFRALCSEIKNDLETAFLNEAVSIDNPSDALQSDFDFIEEHDFDATSLVLILTPEKLMYMLRSAPEMAKDIGLLIYDEGHQFDNGIRGVTYELLLASLKNLVSNEIQIILISAVINNAEQIGNWLIPGEKEIINGTNLLPTYRTVAYANWKSERGMLQFVDPNSPDDVEYFVPKILDQTELKLLGRERKKQLFPIKTQGTSIALYLSLKIIRNGALAIFCGAKKTVRSVCEHFIDLNDRDYDVKAVMAQSDNVEVQKLGNLHSLHFGEQNVFTKSGRLGVFAHSGNTPQGLRLAIEHSMQTGKIKFVVCTSTLAQGVNLPIKYLLITSFYQAQQKIKTRDFHNLIGRAGRSGIHTEGSIIFTDTELYDNRLNQKENYKWKSSKELLDPSKSEPCGSTLLSIFDKLRSTDGIYTLSINILDFVEAYVDDREGVEEYIKKLAVTYARSKFSQSDLLWQLNNKRQVIEAIESFLMAHWDNTEFDSYETVSSNLAKGTLAFALASETQQQQLVSLFILLAKNIKEKVDSEVKRTSFSRTLLGVQDILEIEHWVKNNTESLLVCASVEELVDAIWPILYEKTRNENLHKLVPGDSGLEFLKQWLLGKSYADVLDYLLKKGVKKKWGDREANLDLDFIISICESAFAYDSTLVVSCIIEIVQLQEKFAEEEFVEHLQIFQKQMKYGLPDLLSVAFYEIGFADRIISQDLSQHFDKFPIKRWQLVSAINSNHIQLSSVLSKYPEYYVKVLDLLASSK